MKQDNLITLLQQRKSNSLFIAPTLGGKGKPEDADIIRKEQVEKGNDRIFLERLDILLRKNNKWLLVLFIVIIALMLFLGIIIWKWQANKDYLLGLLGGQGASIVFCINRLSFLYKKKRTSEILLYLYSSAQTPDEKSKIIDKMIEFLIGK